MLDVDQPLDDYAIDFPAHEARAFIRFGFQD